jgi:hypothetical protein
MPLEEFDLVGKPTTNHLQDRRVEGLRRTKGASEGTLSKIEPTAISGLRRSHGCKLPKSRDDEIRVI